MYADVRMGAAARSEFYMWAWYLKNRFRMAVDLKAVPLYCCRQPANLVLVPQVRNDLNTRKCRKCGRRHYEMVLDPGDFSLKMG